MNGGAMHPVPVGLGAGGERMRVPPLRGETENSTPFRRGRSVRRSRRGLLKKRLRRLASALVLIVGTTAAVTWLMTSPRFAVRELAVATGERVPEVWVREALAPVVGENLPRLPLARAERVLRSHPWVQGADLRKDLPARLAVRVAERRAVALLRADDGRLYYVDSRGARITPFDPTAERAVDLPLISIAQPLAGGMEASQSVGPPDPKNGEMACVRSAVQLLSELDEVEPSWIAGLSEIEVLDEKDFRLYTSALPFSVLVRTGTLNQRVRRLEELLPQIVARFGADAAVDLRFARRIIVKPSVEPGSGPRGSGSSWSGRSQSAFKTEHQEATTDHAQRG